MRSIFASLLFFLAGFLCLQAGEPTDLDRMQGNWLVVSLSEKGKAIPAAEIDVLEFVIKKDVFTVYEKGKMVVQYQMKLDPQKTPKAIDLTYLVGLDKGKTEPGIYAFDKEQLKLSLNEATNERPKVFDGKESQSYSVIVLKKKAQ